MSNILGINAYHADSSAVLLNGQKILVGIEEEKIIRKKHWAGFPVNAINYCLKYANITIDEVDRIAINTDPFSNIVPKSFFFLKKYILGSKKFEIYKRLKKKVSIQDTIQKLYNPKNKIKIDYINHHLAHLSSSCYASNFDEALAISIDGFGDFSSIVIAKYKNKKINILKKINFPHSLGVFYEAMTQLLGFKHYGDEYKLMGLSSYGKPIYSDLIIKNIVNPSSLKLNLKLFNHHKNNFSYNFEGNPDQNFIFNEKIFQIFPKDFIYNEKHDIAASTQLVYEKALFEIIKIGLKLYKSKNLCLSGGCGLNSSANGKIIENTEINNLYVPYCPGDSGGAIGSAIQSFHKLNTNNLKLYNLSNPFIGKTYNEKKIIEILNKNLETLNFKKIKKDELYYTVSKEITLGKIIGWFNSSAEFGARALGHRSIIADPRNPNIRDIINTKIKRRENFRPFAPSVLNEHKEEWFHGDLNNFYMESVVKVKEDKKHLIPSVVHIDNTCRVQSVYKENNNDFYNLIKTFYELTNVPILLNTSFNENEPIVESPADAIDCFKRTNMDTLVIDDYLITRK